MGPSDSSSGIRNEFRGVPLSRPILGGIGCDLLRVGLDDRPSHTLSTETRGGLPSSPEHPSLRVRLSAPGYPETSSTVLSPEFCLRLITTGSTHPDPPFLRARITTLPQLHSRSDPQVRVEVPRPSKSRPRSVHRSRSSALRVGLFAPLSARLGGESRLSSPGLSLYGSRFLP